ncbi:hypothetical protein T439DRAFT_247342 [Meredithblackwellia eburnea MCA 4105]
MAIKSGKGKGKGKGKGRDKKPSRPLKLKKVKEVVWDDDARKEFLTGFSKRKKARQTAVRNKAITREKEELRESRQQIRDERKERAANNVRAARELYGDAGGSDEDSSTEENSDSEASDDESPGATGDQTFTTADFQTSVHIEAFSLSRSPSPSPSQSRSIRSPSPAPQQKKKPDPGQLIVEKHKKRVRNKPQARPKMSRKDKIERAKGGKKVKRSFLRGNKGTKGRSDKS